MSDLGPLGPIVNSYVDFFLKIYLFISKIMSECQTIWTLIVRGPDLGTKCMQRLFADNTSTAFKLNRKEESLRVI